jgi:hypothetical protein
LSGQSNNLPSEFRRRVVSDIVREQAGRNALLVSVMENPLDTVLVFHMTVPTHWIDERGERQSRNQVVITVADDLV